MTATTRTAQLTATLATEMGDPTMTAAEILLDAARYVGRGATLTPRELMLMKALEIQAVADARAAAVGPVPFLTVDSRALVRRRSGYYRPGSNATRQRWAAADPRGIAVALRNLREWLV